MKADHLISRSQYGFYGADSGRFVAYILLAIYFQNQHHEKVSVKHLREISINIRNEMPIEDIVANIGRGEIHPPPNREQSRANS